MERNEADKSAQNPFSSLNIGIVEKEGQSSAEVLSPPERNKAQSPGPASSSTRSTRQSRSSCPGGKQEAPRNRSVKRKKDEDMASGPTKSTKKSKADASREDMDVDGVNDVEESDDPFARMQARMQAFMEAQFKTTNDNIRKMNNSITKINDKVGINSRNLDRLRQTVDENSDSTDIELQKIHEIMKEKDESHKKEMQELREELKLLKNRAPAPDSEKNMKTIRDKLDKLEAPSTLPATRPGLDGDCSLDVDFSRARRSFRIWPMPHTASDIRTDALSFITEKLRVPRSYLSLDDIEEVRRVAQRRRKPKNGGYTDPVHDEVMVRLRSSALRDYVSGHVANLSSFVDDNGRPTAGLRMEIPDHLRTQFQDLQSYGRALYKQHGTGFKRHVRFDDREKTLYMDIRLPGSDDWLFVDHKMAAENKMPNDRKNTSLTRERLASSISSNGSVGDEVQVLPHPTTPAGPAPLRPSKTLEKFNGRKGKKSGEWE